MKVTPTPVVIGLPASKVPSLVLVMVVFPSARQVGGGEVAAHGSAASGPAPGLEAAPDANGEHRPAACGGQSVREISTAW
ncbi:hypothetical protein GCM10022255_099850 [Dactylosporangium darangshiense]|uniref:Secreted protein n=1 Tax=Dactylosporangium darangshiense TaxID=579108 RepID=A0ABP8DRK4_9ACTN